MTKCGDIFHVHCLLRKLNYLWITPRIEFGFLNCINCKQRMEVPHHPQINKIITDSLLIEEDVKRKALDRGKFEGLDKDPKNFKYLEPHGRFFNDFQGLAVFKCAYYQCFKCK